MAGHVSAWNIAVRMDLQWFVGNLLIEIYIPIEEFHCFTFVME